MGGRDSKETGMYMYILECTYCFILNGYSTSTYCIAVKLCNVMR